MIKAMSLISFILKFLIYYMLYRIIKLKTVFFFTFSILGFFEDCILFEIYNTTISNFILHKK